MAHRMRKGLVLGVSAAAALMMFSSAAFACTNFLGKMTVVYTGPNALATTSTADGYKPKGGMLYCNHDGNRANMSSFAQGSSSSGDHVQVTVQPNTCVSGHSSFTTQIGAATNYHIYGMSGVWNDTSGTTSQDCMGSPATDLTPGADQTVTSSTSPQTFTSTVTFSPGAGNTVICFDVTATQAVDSAPEINTNMVV